MNLSIFDNDGTLGAANARGVVIELKGQTPQYSIYYTAEPILIRDTLNSKGWSVQLVVETSGGIFGYGQRTWNIFASVLNNYSDADIIHGVRRDLSDVMTVNSVSVANGSASNPNGYSSSDKPNGNDPITWLGNKADNVVDSVTGSAVPATVIIGGAALLLVLLLRR